MDPNTPQRRAKKIWIGLLTIFCLIAYDPSKMENTSGDSLSARYWPVAILEHGTLHLTPLRSQLDGVAYAAIFMSSGEWIPRADLGILVFTLPVYALAHLLEIGGPEWTHERVSQISRWNGILIAILSVILLFLFLCRFLPDGSAFAGALLFGVSGWNWTIGAQGISTQGCAVLLHVASFHLLWKLCHPTDDRSTFRILFFLGLICGLAWATRAPSLFMIVAPLLLMRTAQKILRFLVGFLAIAGPVMFYNKLIYSTPLGWRGVLAQLTSGTTSDYLLQGSIPEGMAGLLFSPNRGALIFFPLLFLVPLLWNRLLPTVHLRELLSPLLRLRLPEWGKTSKNGIPENFSGTLLLGAVFYFIAISSYREWHSTWSWGARYLYDLQPYVWPAIALGVHETLRWVIHKTTTLPQWVPVLLILFSIQGTAIHALGHSNFDIYLWNFREQPTLERSIWRWSPSMVYETWEAGSNRHRWPSAEFRLKRFGF